MDAHQKGKVKGIKEDEYKHVLVSVMSETLKILVLLQSKFSFLKRRKLEIV